MGLILTLLAYLLLVIFTPIGILYSIIRNLFKVNKYFLNLALSLDQLGNAVMSTLFNDILIKKEGYLFGDIDSTLSSVLGKNKINNTLTKLGSIICYILNKIEDNHVENAANSKNNN